MAGVALQAGPTASKQKEAGTAQLQQQSRGMSYVQVYIDTETTHLHTHATIWLPYTMAYRVAPYHGRDNGRSRPWRERDLAATETNAGSSGY